MIKYFHELTDSDIKGLIESKITWEQVAKDYPQPSWCHYPNATGGDMGCWSLIEQSIKDINSCGECEFCQAEI